jgi:hypothetical protein
LAASAEKMYPASAEGHYRLMSGFPAGETSKGLEQGASGGLVCVLTPTPISISIAKDDMLASFRVIDQTEVRVPHKYLTRCFVAW